MWFWTRCYSILWRQAYLNKNYLQVQKIKLLDRCNYSSTDFYRLITKGEWAHQNKVYRLPALPRVLRSQFQFRALRLTFLAEFFSALARSLFAATQLAFQGELAIKLWIVNVTMYKDMAFLRHLTSEKEQTVAIESGHEWLSVLEHQNTKLLANNVR